MALQNKTTRFRSTAALPDTVKEALKEATKELANGNLALVPRLLRKVGKHPVEKERLHAMWSDLGRACYLAGRYVEMEEACTEAHALDSKGSGATFNLALAKSLNNKIAEAEELYQEAGQKDPRNPKVWVNLGALYFLNDRFAEAEQAFRTALDHRPDYARAWDSLASALAAQGKTEEAIEACRKAIETRPGYPEAYFRLSAIYFGKGDPASLTAAAASLGYVLNYAPLADSVNSMLAMIRARLDQGLTSKFYKGNPHPYDENLPSFAAINIWETGGDDASSQLSCEFITLAPDPIRDEANLCYRWKLIVEQVELLPEDTRQGMFPRVKRLVEERGKRAYILASKPTRDTMVYSAGHAFRLNAELSEDQFLRIVAQCTHDDQALFDGMLEKAQCPSFRDVVGKLKQG
jgi:tetratricopeptide (TPR) repeat protein